ncbi:hypothetical protein ECZC19_26200 [Escherichia coli]|nr:hypothetical protein ECZC19_26200 [Escherichia coli]
MASKADGTRPENSLAVPGVPTGFDPFVIQFQRVRDIARSVPELRKIINQMKNKDLINYFCL